MTRLTAVELLWIEGKIERWIRFGHIAEDQILDRQRRLVSFASGSVFAFVRWASNDYGTLVSRIDILRACHHGEPVTTVPGVNPGGEILLRLSGWWKVERALEAIDAVEALGIAPENTCPDHWRQIHNRIAAARPPEPYSLQRHRAWLLRQRIDR